MTKMPSAPILRRFAPAPPPAAGDAPTWQSRVRRVWRGCRRTALSMTEIIAAGAAGPGKAR